MKKRMSKIISILLVSALVVSVGDVAQAGDLEENGTEVQLVEDGAEVEPVIGDEVVEGLVEEPSEDVAEEDGDAGFIDDGEELPAPVIEDVQEAPEKKEIEYDEKIETEEKEKKLDAAPEEEEEVLDIAEAQKYLAADIKDPLINDIAINKVSKVKDAEKIADDKKSVAASVIGYDISRPFSKKVTLLKGTVLIAATSPTVSIEGVKFTSARNSYVGIYSDAQLTKMVGQITVYKGVDHIYSGIVNISKTGNYYVGIKPDSKEPDSKGNTENLVSLGICSFDGSDRVIKSGQELIVGQKNAKQVNYFKYKATATGYIRTYANEEVGYRVKVTLCNSKKKSLSAANFVGLNPTYGVKKGKTYWIKLTNSSLNSDGFYAFKIKSSKVSEKSGKKKSKAVNIKRKKTINGTIEAGVNQADWYKFKLTGKKKVTITYKCYSDDDFRITVYYGKQSDSRTMYSNTKKGTIPSSGKWPKGTYYIKVERAKKTKASGYYSLKWS